MDGFDDYTFRLGQPAEPVAHGRLRFRDRNLRCRHDGGAVPVAQLGVFTHPGEDLGEVRGAEHGPGDLPVLVGELGDLVEADLVDLLRGHVGGCEVVERSGIRLVAAGEVTDAGAVVGPRGRDDNIPDGVPPTSQSRC